MKFGHRQPAHRQAARQQPTQQARQGAARVWAADPNDLRRHFADEELRRLVRRQLNKGENPHALRRDCSSPTRARSAAASTTRSTKRSARPWSPTPPCSGPPPTSATLDARRDDGVEGPDELAAHLTPAQHDHIKCCGTSSFDVDHAHHYLILKRSRTTQIRSVAEPTPNWSA